MITPADELAERDYACGLDGRYSNGACQASEHQLLRFDAQRAMRGGRSIIGSLTKRTAEVEEARQVGRGELFDLSAHRLFVFANKQHDTRPCACRPIDIRKNDPAGVCQYALERVTPDVGSRRPKPVDVAREYLGEVVALPA